MRRRWGQNFLTDHNIAGKIVAAAQLCPDDTVIEIGPGKGILTGMIAGIAGRVLAVEIDPRLVGPLAEELKAYPGLEVINEDFLETDLEAMLSGVSAGKSTVKVISNLPYNITSPVMAKILTVPARFRPLECVFMVQKEVANRLKAVPGSKDYSMLSIAVQYNCDVKKLFAVSKKVFRPRPTVDSTVIRLTLRKEPTVKVNDEKLFFKIARASFSQRRKKFYNTAGNAIGIKKEKLFKILEEVEVNPNCRPENLSLGEFARIVDLIKKEQG